VIAGGRVWVTAAVDDRGGSLRLLSFDAATGAALTDTEVFRGRGGPAPNVKNSHASPTPIVDGERVYVHFGASGTAAVTTDGKVIWKVVLAYQSQHGNGGSPALFEDLLIVNCDGGDQAFVVALDTRTGQVRWQTPRRQPFDQAYTTPLVIAVNGRDQLISVGAYRAAAYDPRTGRELWRVSYGSGFSNVPRPVYGHGLVYIATGFQQPTLIAVRADGTGDVTRSHVAWTMTRAAPYTPSPILVGDELYVVSDIGIATCLDATTGAVHWMQRLGGNYSASPIYADGRVYFLNEEGTATVIAPGRAFQVLARNTLDGATLASIGVSGGSLFIRTDSHLYRIGRAG
jgi:outer membrane protein assembly factor BamB